MPARSQFVSHVFGGGWATDYGPQFYGTPGQDGQIVLPFLVEAKNCIYELDGGPHKCPGVTKVNASVVNNATTKILATFDYWRQGTSGSPTQRRLIYTNEGKIYADAADGVFSSIKTGLDTGAAMNFSVYNDLLIISNDAVADVPMSWDQTTFQNLAGSPPNFSFSVKHKNRQWAAGIYATPSRLHYSVLGSPEDWTGAGSGSIDIDLGDGDMITGLASYKDQLWVFKGPYKGSIHQIAGSSPTGSDAFSRKTFINGITAAWQSTIFEFSDDLGFVSPWGTLHSMKATASFGNFNQYSLSFPINTYLKTSVARNRLRYCWAVNDVQAGRVLITFAGTGSTDNNRVLMMDYRFGYEPPNIYPRFALWDAFAWGSLANSVDPSNANQPTIIAGSYIGFVFKTNSTTKSNNGTAINMTVKTPFLTYGPEYMLKTIARSSLGILPYNSNAMTFGWTNDDNAEQTTTVEQGGGAVLDEFILDTDVLGGGRFAQRFMELETGGDFRAIQYRITDSINNSDLELHSFGADISASGVSAEN